MTLEPVRVVIVDDEPAARAVVHDMLSERPDIAIVGEAANGPEAIALIRERAPDLAFLDVQMPDCDGFSVLEALGDDVPRGVVFVTAHDEHAVRAFEVHALDYVLKPFGRQRFAAAVTQALDRLRALRALTLQQTLASMMVDRQMADGEGAVAELTSDGGGGGPEASTRVSSGAPRRRLSVRSGSKISFIDVDAIDWVQADGDYARIHVGKQSYLISQRMDTLERLLANGFVRTHRSILVHAQRISELHRESDGSGFVVLRDGVRLRVARGRWDALAQALEV
jgi:two-component system LytT family response regulator